jgi:hypothetical protein
MTDVIGLTLGSAGLLILVIGAICFARYERKHNLYNPTLMLYFTAIWAIASSFSTTRAWTIAHHIFLYFLFSGFFLYFVEIIKLFSVLPSSWLVETTRNVQLGYILVTFGVYTSVIVIEITNYDWIVKPCNLGKILLVHGIWGNNCRVYNLSSNFNPSGRLFVY